MPKYEAAVVAQKAELRIPQNVKLMDPEWEAERVKRDKTQKGLLKRNIETLYIMGAYSGRPPENREVLKIVLTHKDGSKSEKILVAEEDIGSVDDSKDLNNAIYVGNGFYVTRWQTPDPTLSVKDITLIPNGKVILGGITATLLREKMFYSYD